MFSLYSKSCKYAIRALVEILRDGNKDSCRARDICRKAEIPEAYARKTFQLLVRNGFLKAITGPGGGYALNRDPKKTTVMDVLAAVEGEKHFTDCVLGLSVCSDTNPCPLHHIWLGVKKPLIKALESQTLAELASEKRKKKS